MLPDRAESGLDGAAPPDVTVDLPPPKTPQGFGPENDGAAPAEAGGSRPDAGLTGDGGSKTATVSGCTCRLNASTNQEESRLWGLAGLALVAGIARRRRRRL